MTTVRVVWLGAVALLWADGVLDGAVAPDLHHAAQALLADGPTTVVLDLSAVIAIDDGAVSVLAAVAARLNHQHAVLELRLPAGRAQRVADAAQLRSILTTAYPPAGPVSPA